MKLYNYLTEDKDKGEELVPLLENNRVFDLYLNGMQYLYRGIFGGYHTFKYRLKKVVKERRPKDSKKYLHDAFDMTFHKKFGIKGRTECTFATSNKTMAEYYGKPFIFIPLEPFKFLYSPVVYDLWALNDPFRRNRITLLNNDETDILNNPDDEGFQKVIEKVVSTYKTDNLKSAISSGNEIMFDCKEYIIFKPVHFELFVFRNFGVEL